MCVWWLVTTAVVSVHAEPEVVVYSVRPGDSLGRIARKHEVTIDAICRANARVRTQKLHPGDKLIIPAHGRASSPEGTTQDSNARRDGGVRSPSNAGAALPRADLARLRPRVTPAAQATLDAQNRFPLLGTVELWRKYAKPPLRPGHVSLTGHGRNFDGPTEISERHVPEATRRAFGHILFDHRNGEEAELSSRLVRLLVRVSDTFGGRQINVVSGYRETSYALESRHPRGAACDFSIAGVPNLALFAFLSRLAHVGVGYYPNSSFVHLDVRATKAIWVDLAGPGEPPRYVEPGEYFATASVARNGYGF